MQQVSPVITRQTTMWKAWVGFNASHSYGLRSDVRRAFTGGNQGCDVPAAGRNGRTGEPIRSEVQALYGVRAKWRRFHPLTIGWSGP